MLQGEAKATLFLINIDGMAQAGPRVTVSVAVCWPIFDDTFLYSALGE